MIRCVTELLIQFVHAERSYFYSVLMGDFNMIFQWVLDFFGAMVQQVFVMLSKKKVIFVINMLKFITSYIRHLQKKNRNPIMYCLSFIGYG